MYGKKIKALRERLNLSRQDLAEKLDVSSVSVGKYENDQTNPSIETIKKLIEEFNLNINYLLFNSKNMFKTDEEDAFERKISLEKEKISNTIKRTRSKDLIREKVNTIKTINELQKKLIEALETNRKKQIKIDYIVKNTINLIYTDEISVDNFLKLIYKINENNKTG